MVQIAQTERKRAATTMNNYSLTRTNRPKSAPDYSVLAQQVKAALNFADTVMFYGVQFNSKGFALCPFHKEKTGSFGVVGDRGHCFGCGWHGDIIQFVSHMFGLDFRQSIEKLNTDFGLGLPIGRRATLSEAAAISSTRRRMERERAERERAETERLERFTELWGEYAELDRILTEQRPTNPDDEISPQFLDALKRIEYGGFKIDEEI